jgi:hypothetical protein
MGYPNVIEGIQSTQIARTLKNRRSFSRENIYKILMINVAQYNNWQINFKENKKTIFDFEEPIDIITSLTNSRATNIPLLQSSHKQTVMMLNNIIHRTW